MKTHAHLLDILAGSPIFRDYQRAFSEATGLPLSLQALDDWGPVFRGVAKKNSVLPDDGGPKPTPFPG